MQWYYWEVEQGEGIQVRKMYKWCSVKRTVSKLISLGMDQKPECVGAFRYLGDTIGVGGGAEHGQSSEIVKGWSC